MVDAIKEADGARHDHRNLFCGFPKYSYVYVPLRELPNYLNKRRKRSSKFSGSGKPVQVCFRLILLMMS
jgi:hypothetical protein